jgi:hypothetical protein
MSKLWSHAQRSRAVVTALLFIFAQNSFLLRVILVYIYQTFTLFFLDNIVQNKILCNYNCLDKICIKISVGSNFIMISVIDKF